jgi:uncharacterized protein (UPF0276 family)
VAWPNRAEVAVAARACRGHGYGLRVPHYAELLERGSDAEWAEAVTENFVGRGGRARAVLERVRKDSRLVLHGVSLSIGAMDPLDNGYVRALAELSHDIDAAWISDHLCFGSVAGHYAHDLWPLPYTEEALIHVVARVREVQELLGQRILLENISTYVAYGSSTLDEWEFLAAVAALADCFILLDVNNVCVSAKNHGFDPRAYIDALPVDRVRQLHLAGHTDYGTHAIDDHGSAVSDSVWELYRHTLRRLGPVPTIVEWDENVPALERLAAESRRARAIEAEVLSEARAS